MGRVLHGLCCLFALLLLGGQFALLTAFFLQHCLRQQGH
jgi:hypothetical protein